MKQRMLKSTGALLVAMLFGIMSTGHVFAYSTYNGHSCKRGAGLYYYIYSSASVYEDDIITGMYRWTITNSPASLDRTYETGPSSIDVFKEYRSDPPFNGFNAWTEHVRQDYGAIDPNEEDWDYARVYLNSRNMSPNQERSCVIVCHEVGHAFGLGHTWNPSNIMCPESGGRTAHNPSADDVAGINYLY